ncbi:hypothetical protein BSU00_00845 [Tenacibaculum sp. SG-28]|nr:hypothetical protein BSU00_00845 [Tenacibaculum sp. SG-28]
MVQLLLEVLKHARMQRGQVLFQTHPILHWLSFRKRCNSTESYTQCRHDIFVILNLVLGILNILIEVFVSSHT